MRGVLRMYYLTELESQSSIFSGPWRTCVFFDLSSLLVEVMALNLLVSLSVLEFMDLTSFSINSGSSLNTAFLDQTALYS